jgi:hypothetical protein
MSAIYGTFGKLALGASSPTSRIEFEMCDMRLHESVENYAGVQGVRGELASRNRLGNVVCSGTLTCTPTPAEWVILLPFILGGTPSGTSYPLAEVLPTFVMDLSDGTTCKQYTGCTIGSAEISAQSGGPLKLSCQIEAIDEGSDTFPSLTIDQTYGPFMYYESAWTIASVTATPFDFRIGIDNRVDTGRFLNSRTRTSLIARGRAVDFRCRLPWGDFYTNLYGIQSSEVSAAGVFTSAGYSISLTMPKIRFPREGPTGRNREAEMEFVLDGRARKTNGTTDELQVVLDSTP